MQGEENTAKQVATVAQNLQLTNMAACTQGRARKQEVRQCQPHAHCRNKTSPITPTAALKRDLIVLLSLAWNAMQSPVDNTLGLIAMCRQLLLVQLLPA